MIAEINSHRNHASVFKKRTAFVSNYAIILVGLVSFNVLNTTSSQAYYWSTINVPGTSSQQCQDGMQCAIASYVQHEGQGPSYCYSGGLDIVWCNAANNVTHGASVLTCEGNEVLTLAGCVIPRGKDPWCPAKVGEPIDAKAGVLREEHVDYSSAGPHPLVLKRVYWSDVLTLLPTPSRLGAAWATNFDAALYIGGDGGVAGARLPDGREMSWNYSTPNGTSKEQLISLGSSGWRVITEDGTGYVFDTTGQLNQIVYLDGYTQTLTWSNGKNTSVSDSLGRVLNFSYDASTGLLSQAQDGGGETITFTYKNTVVGYTAGTSITPQSYVLASVTYADSTSISYLYDNPAYHFALTGIVDERGVQISSWSWTSPAAAVGTSLTYEAQGVVSSNNLAGGVSSFSLAYDYANSKTTVTNPLGKQTIYHYDASQLPSLLTQVEGVPSTNCVGSNSTLAYDGNKNLVQETDEEGRIIAYSRESRGLPTSITRGYGTSSAVTRTITWHPTLTVPTQIVEPGLTTDYVWNSVGQLTSMTKTDTTSQSVPYSTNGQTRTWAYTYNSVGALASAQDPVGQTVSYTYDSHGAIQTVTNELGQVTTVNATNYRGQPTSITDPNGIITSFTYDARGRLKTVSNDSGNSAATTTIGYNATGDITTITDPIGAVSTYTYDDARRLMGISNSLGESITYTRDNMGNVTSNTLKNPGGTTTYSQTRVFDELGRIIKSVGAVAANSQYQFGYDKTNNLTSTTDPRSYVFSYGFDALNRLQSEVDEQGGSVSFTRNGIDEITGYKDARNLTSSYVRNGFGEIIQEVSPDRGTTTYVRDARGLITKRTDARGIAINYFYDNAGRLTDKNADGYSWAQYHQTFSWDQAAPNNPALGKLVGRYSESGVDWMTFDTKGRITTDFRTNNPAPAVTVNYYYDTSGNVTGMTYPSGRWVAFQRDSIGRISAITTDKNSVSKTILYNTTWSPFGPLTGYIVGNDLHATFTLDTDYRVTRVQVQASGNTNPSQATVDRSLSWTGETLDSITDNHSPGQTPSFNLSHQSQTLGYTATHRLSAATGYYGTFAWTYDANGNRLTEQLGSSVSTYSYPSTSNRLTSVTAGTSTPRTFTYDAAGNVLTDTRSGTLGMTFEYDVEGRLAHAYQTNTPAVSGTYLYDAYGRLASRTVTQATAPTSTTTLYVYDLKDHVIAETDTSGVTQREYVWMDDLPVAVVDQASSSNPVVYYVHTDHLGRPVKMTDLAWNWVWDVVYSPFGAVSYINQNPAVMDLRFPGQWFQLENGLAYNWHRHYDPTIGRYLQSDPLGLTALLSDGPSIYGYVGQSPLVVTDFEGTQWLQAIQGTVRACAANATCVSAATTGAYMVSQTVKKLLKACIPNNNYDDCQALYEQITRYRNEVAKRLQEYREDKFNLPMYGPMSRETHIDQLRGWQRGLRRLLTEADTRACKAYEPDAWFLATAPVDGRF